MTNSQPSLITSRINVFFRNNIYDHLPLTFSVSSINGRYSVLDDFPYFWPSNCRFPFQVLQATASGMKAFHHVLAQIRYWQFISVELQNNQ